MLKCSVDKNQVCFRQWKAERFIDEYWGLFTSLFLIKKMLSLKLSLLLLNQDSCLSSSLSKSYISYSYISYSQLYREHQVQLGAHEWMGTNKNL